MLLAVGGAASVAGEAYAGRTFRVAARDLEDGSTYPQLVGQWRLYAMRFYRDEACAPQSALDASVVAEATVTVSKTYAPSTSPLSNCDGPFGGVVCSGPQSPLSDSASPGLAMSSWVGAPALGLEQDGAWIQLDWPTDQTIGCVKLFQDTFQTASSLSLQAAGADGELVLVAASPGRACPQDAPTACCVCGIDATSGCDWNCPALTILRTAPHPPPSPPPEPPLAPWDERNGLSSGLDNTEWPLLIITLVFLFLLLLLLCCSLYACYRGWVCGSAKDDDDGRTSYRSQLFMVRPGNRNSNQPMPYGSDDEQRASVQSPEPAYSAAIDAPAGDYPDDPAMVVRVREAHVRGGETISLVQVDPPAETGTPVPLEGVRLQVHSTEVRGAGTINIVQRADPEPPAAATAVPHTAERPTGASPMAASAAPAVALEDVSLVVREASVGKRQTINVVERI